MDTDADVRVLRRDRVVYQMGTSAAPVARVEPGEILLVETEDCFSHQVLGPGDSLEKGFDYSRVNPATGPIWVEGARPGDVLVVDIRRISPDPTGVVACHVGWGPLGHRVSRSHIEMARIEGGVAVLSMGKVPARPMVGVIGVAPLGEPVPNSTPGRHGGNLDTREVTEGASIYLPVFVEGALLALGDVHAAMGDGEVCGTGVEARATVEIRVGLRPGAADTWSVPVVDFGEALYVLGSGPHLEEAIEQAEAAAVEFLRRHNGVSWAQAYMLASIGTHLLVSQVVNPWKTVKVRVPKALLRAA